MKSCEIKTSNYGRPTTDRSSCNWADSRCILLKRHTDPHLFIEKDGSLSWWEYNPMEDSDCMSNWNPSYAIGRAQMADVRLYCLYAVSENPDILWSSSVILSRMRRRQITAEKYGVRLPWIEKDGALVFVPTDWAKVVDQY